ncbi:voltage-gated potassium channel [Gracilibacillus ureilyticus]|uniref:Voltage-gated potassium channel n=2 Tax=Gracilibacillus ureilyticus TaxID=531814 RepID=A0A1H9LVD0_9BACI|nr:voltage-gated potassium channel [Gracilibacillus ureilyticus]
MIALVVITILTLWTENEVNSAINWIVWLIFFIDFVIRFIVVESKWSFIKKNPFLLIAIIPFDQFFQLARIVRIIYLFRIKTITKYYVEPYLKKMNTMTKFILSILVPILLLIESVGVWLMDNKFYQWPDAFMVVFKHLFMFANSLESVEHFPTIICLTITSILGVIIQGLALQWALNKFETIYRDFKSAY